MDNVRASKVKQKLFGVQTEEERLAFQSKMGRYIVNTKINFESRWKFNLCEQRPVDSAFQWEVSDQELAPFIYRNSIINAGVTFFIFFMNTVSISKSEI